MVTGAYVDPKAGRTLVRDYARQWQAAQVGAPATMRNTDQALRLHILLRLGDRPLGSLRRSDIQGLVKAISEHLAPGSVCLTCSVLAKMLGAAVEDRLLASTPCQRIGLPAIPGHEVVPPTPEQVAGVAERIAPQLRAAVALLAGSGLRIGEALGLRVADVDFFAAPCAWSASGTRTATSGRPKRRGRCGRCRWAG